MFLQFIIYEYILKTFVCFLHNVWINQSPINESWIPLIFFSALRTYRKMQSLRFSKTNCDTILNLRTRIRINNIPFNALLCSSRFWLQLSPAPKGTALTKISQSEMRRETMNSSTTTTQTALLHSVLSWDRRTKEKGRSWPSAGPQSQKVGPTIKNSAGIRATRAAANQRATLHPSFELNIYELVCLVVAKNSARLEMSGAVCRDVAEFIAAGTAFPTQWTKQGSDISPQWPLV